MATRPGPAPRPRSARVAPARRGSGGRLREVGRPVDESEDKFRDECGVFGVFGHADAANLTYLGLYALQHRGQESAGIASWNGKRILVEKGMGYVADLFDETRLARLG